MTTLNQYAAYYSAQRHRMRHIAEKIESVYKPIDNDFKLDPTDQVHFAVALYHAISFFKPEQVVQTGTFTGVSAIAMLNAANDHGIPIHITTIDPEPEYYFNTKNAVDIARQAVRHHPMGQRVTFIKGYSGPSPEEERNGPPGRRLEHLPCIYDMIVIDGDHSFKGAYNDLKKGYKKLRNGKGVMFVHDYNGIPEVRAAVDLWINRSGTANQAINTEHPCGLAIIQS